MNVNKVIQKGNCYTIENILCENPINGEPLSLVTAACSLGPNLKFVWELTVRGANCSERTCSFKVESLSTKKWEALALIQTGRALNVDFLCSLKYNENVIRRLSLSHRHSVQLPTGRYDLVYEMYAVDRETKDDKLLNLKQKEKLNRGFEELFETKKYWDVQVIVEGNELVAHKCVLASSSKVLAAMLEQDTEEAKAIKIYIDDVDTETVNEMLRFIYTGKVLNGSKLANQLLVAGDIFDLEGLKTVGGIELAKNISVNNAADTFISAHLHQEQNLKNHTSYFIRNNLEAVRDTEGWNSVKEKYADVIAPFLK